MAIKRAIFFLLIIISTICAKLQMTDLYLPEIFINFTDKLNSTLITILEDKNKSYNKPWDFAQTYNEHQRFLQKWKVDRLIVSRFKGDGKAFAMCKDYERLAYLQKNYYCAIAVFVDDCIKSTTLFKKRCKEYKRDHLDKIMDLCMMTKENFEQLANNKPITVVFKPEKLNLEENLKVIYESSGEPFKLTQNTDDEEPMESDVENNNEINKRKISESDSDNPVKRLVFNQRQKPALLKTRLDNQRKSVDANKPSLMSHNDSLKALKDFHAKFGQRKISADQAFKEQTTTTIKTHNFVPHINQSTKSKFITLKQTVPQVNRVVPGTALTVFYETNNYNTVANKLINPSKERFQSKTIDHQKADLARLAKLKPYLVGQKVRKVVQYRNSSLNSNKGKVTMKNPGHQSVESLDDSDESDSSDDVKERNGTNKTNQVIGKTTQTKTKFKIIHYNNNYLDNIKAKIDTRNNFEPIRNERLKLVDRDLKFKFESKTHNNNFNPRTRAVQITKYRNSRSSSDEPIQGIEKNEGNPNQRFNQNKRKLGNAGDKKFDEVEEENDEVEDPNEEGRPVREIYPSILSKDIVGEPHVMPELSKHLSQESSIGSNSNHNQPENHRRSDKKKNQNSKNPNQPTSSDFSDVEVDSPPNTHDTNTTPILVKKPSVIIDTTVRKSTPKLESVVRKMSPAAMLAQNQSFSNAKQEQESFDELDVDEDSNNHDSFYNRKVPVIERRNTFTTKSQQPPTSPFKTNPLSVVRTQIIREEKRSPKIQSSSFGSSSHSSFSELNSSKPSIRTIHKDTSHYNYANDDTILENHEHSKPIIYTQAPELNDSIDQSPISKGRPSFNSFEKKRLSNKNSQTSLNSFDGIIDEFDSPSEVGKFFNKNFNTNGEFSPILSRAHSKKSKSEFSPFDEEASMDIDLKSSHRGFQRSSIDRISRGQSNLQFDASPFNPTSSPGLSQFNNSFDADSFKPIDQLKSKSPVNLNPSPFRSPIKRQPHISASKQNNNSKYNNNFTINNIGDEEEIEVSGGEDSFDATASFKLRNGNSNQLKEYQVDEDDSNSMSSGRKHAYLRKVPVKRQSPEFEDIGPFRIIEPLTSYQSNKTSPRSSEPFVMRFSLQNGTQSQEIVPRGTVTGKNVNLEQPIQEINNSSISIKSDKIRPKQKKLMKILVIVQVNNCSNCFNNASTNKGILLALINTKI